MLTSLLFPSVITYCFDKFPRTINLVCGNPLITTSKESPLHLQSVLTAATRLFVRFTADRMVCQQAKMADGKQGKQSRNNQCEKKSKQAGKTWRRKVII